MNFEPKLYDQTNSIQMTMAMELISSIKEDFRESPIDIALDIGCGSGNITRLLKKSINIDLIYGSDVDQSMIDFAGEDKTTDGLRFVCQDFGKDFAECPTLKSLEGKVSLVFSNYCFQWIEDIDAVVDNISRLCAPNARVYLGFTLIEERGRMIFESSMLNKIMGVMSMELLPGMWSQKFEHAGFTIDMCESFVEDGIIDESTYQQHLIPVVTELIKPHFPYIMGWFWSHAMTRLAMYTLFSHYYIPFVDQKTGKHMRKMNQTNIIIKLTKNI